MLKVRRGDRLLVAEHEARPRVFFGVIGFCEPSIRRILRATVWYEI